MREIRKLHEEDLREFARLAVNAYPAVHTNIDETEKRLVKTLHDDKTIEYYGLFEQGQLLGGMRFHHYEMNVFGKMVPVAGIGSVEVDLLHKKEKIAKDMLYFFIEHYHKKGVHFLSLYPFRQQFYKQMGFGIGSKKHQYRIKPTSFPKGSSKANLRYITAQDKEQLRACHSRYVTKTHGMFYKTEMELNAIFENANLRTVAYFKDDVMLGYVSFGFRRASDETFLKNNLHIVELIYETPEVLSEILTFLHSQADQIDRIIVNTQDEYFHHLLSDPSNGTDRLIPSVFHESNTSGIGIMYRINDVKGAFAALAHRNFGGQTLTIKINVEDTFYPVNQGSTVVKFAEGRVILDSKEEVDVEISLDISDFSSLILGVVPFRTLYNYGLIKVSSTRFLDQLDKIFFSADKPICMSSF